MSDVDDGGQGGAIAPGSVLAGLDPARVSGDQALAYEVAVEGLRAVVGRYTGLLAQHRCGPNPDPATLAALTAAVEQWTQRLRHLDSRDAQAVDAAQQDSARELAALRADASNRD
ncbi:MAG TPA: hypothetical protein VFP72_23055 [Kineosporiaceae bacterium]|nr:hypothetical protein [Kineosporiaceae bacterium]